MEPLHPLLRAQLERHLDTSADTLPEPWHRILAEISNAYRTADRQVHEEQRLLESIATGFAGLFWMIDDSGRLVRWNRNLENLAGLPPDRLAGHELVGLVAAEDRRMAGDALRRILQGETLAFDCGFLNRTGTPVPHRFAGRRVLVANRPLALGTAVDVSERKRAEDALAFSQERFALAMDAANDGLWDWHIPTDKGYFSPRYCTMLGYQPEELIPGHSFWTALLHPDDRDTTERRFLEYLRGATDTYESEFRMRARDGSWVWILSRGRVIERAPDGRPVRVMGTHSDITDRKVAEQQLRESEERLRLALEATNIGLYDLDLRTGNAVVTPEYARMLGYDPAEFHETNQAWLARLHPDDHDATQRAFSDYLAGKTTDYRIEFRQRTRDGSWRWFLSLGKIVAHDAAGQPVRMLGTHTDITHRRQAEASLLESEERLRQAIRISGIGIFDHDHLTDHIHWSPEMREMHGFAADTVQTVNDVLSSIHPDDRESVLTAILQSHNPAGDGLYEADYRVNTPPDSPPRWIAARGQTFFAGEGPGRHAVRTVGASIDITERRLHEQHMARSNDELESRVAERTRQLAEAKQAAEAASEAKSRFLAMMSHEIRTPLNGVTGVLHLLGRETLTAQQRHWIGIASTSANALLHVINDILDFSKVEAGKLDLSPVPTDLHETVRETAETFAPKIAARGLHWRLHIDPSVPVTVEADPHRLAQILANLLGNSSKFTETGSIHLDVSTLPNPQGSQRAAGTVRIRFVVTDTGPGISRADQARLFKPFTQVDNSATRRHGGTGLGLGICKHLVRLMGGDIGVSSEPGQGTTFWFEIPFRTPASPTTPTPTPTTAPTAPTQVQVEAPRHGRVLIAEDNEINQELAREMMRVAGCECDCVDNGRAAIQAAVSGRYALVFMDCMMPDVGGNDATREIRNIESALPGHPRVPIVAMTANAMDSDRDACLAAGMDDFLPKPLDPDQVIRTIHKWLPSRPETS